MIFTSSSFVRLRCCCCLTTGRSHNFGHRQNHLRPLPKSGTLGCRNFAGRLRFTFTKGQEQVVTGDKRTDQISSSATVRKASRPALLRLQWARLR